MQPLDTMNNLAEIEKVLRQIRTIAVIGLSPKENRPSNMVGRYLKDVGYTIFPVNPGQEEILGEKCYPSVDEIKESIDVVDIFRRAEDVLPIVEEVLRLPVLPQVIWMQLGIVNEKAAALARSKGLLVVMDRCIKVDHQNMLQK